MAFTGFSFLKCIFSTALLIKMISDLDGLNERRGIGPKIGHILNWISGWMEWNKWVIGFGLNNKGTTGNREFNGTAVPNRECSVRLEINSKCSSFIASNISGLLDHGSGSIYRFCAKWWGLFLCTNEECVRPPNSEVFWQKYFPIINQNIFGLEYPREFPPLDPLGMRAENPPILVSNSNQLPLKIFSLSINTPKSPPNVCAK